jgi:hypothetical protein
MDKSLVQMRDFMILTESLVEPDEAPIRLIDEPETMTPMRSIYEDLQDAVFKMRAFTESCDGDVGFGVELGLQRAADMIENVINRHRGKDQ